MLAGGLLLFATSVPPPRRQFAAQLLDRAQQHLRSDPTITMELGMGVEAGGVYASSFATTSAAVADNGAPRNQVVEQLVLQFQITGGNAWAAGVAYGCRTTGNTDRAGADEVQLVSLEVANMDAAWKGAAFRVPI